MTNSVTYKEIKQFKCKIEERISKKGTPYRVLQVEVGITWKDIGFLTPELEFALYKAGIKI